MAAPWFFMKQVNVIIGLHYNDHHTKEICIYLGNF